MTASLVHSPAYATGSRCYPDCGVGVGWACHRGSYGDCLPIVNEAKDVVIFFAGEHFAEASDIQGLKMKGHSFEESNASYLAHLYEESGPAFYETLNGTFSGLLLDLRKGETILFNDRFGLGRIYTHEREEGVYFSSEAKSLLGVFPEARSLDIAALGEYLSLGCVLRDRTLFNGIGLLPPASRWSARKGKVIERRKYVPASSPDPVAPFAPGDYYQRLSSTFSRILPKYFSGGQKVGLSLTGGLDSRMIIAAMSDRPGTLPCYTFGGQFRDCADVRLGRQIAEICRQSYQVINVGDEFIRQFPELSKRCVYLTDGAMDVSGAVGLYANRLAREIAPVRMTGNYGSEILRQHVAFKPKELGPGAFALDLVASMAEGAATYWSERRSRSPLAFITEVQLPWHHYARLAEEQSQLVIRAPYLDHQIVALAHGAPDGELLNKQLAYRYTEERCPALTGFPTDRGSLERPRFVPSRLFTFSKEFLPRLEYLYDYGMPDWLAKVDRVLAGLHLERLILGQQKYYFFRLWYRDHLASFVREVLLDRRTLSLPYLDGKGVAKAVREHTEGSANHTTLIHKLLTLAFLDNSLLRVDSPADAPKPAGAHA